MTAPEPEVLPDPTEPVGGGSFDDTGATDDVPAEVWVARASLGLLGSGGILLVAAFVFAIAAVWTGGSTSAQLSSTAGLCAGAGALCLLLGWAGLRSLSDDQRDDDQGGTR